METTQPDMTRVIPSEKYKLDHLPFDNCVIKDLPKDPQTKNYVRAVRGAIVSITPPTPCENPRLVSFSAPALDLLGIDPTEVIKPEFAEYFSGNKILPGSTPISLCYCGHQFGNFAGQLGDGRAISLGDLINSTGERWEIQLKGAGPTPYSRQADGRAVLRSSIREFLCSEAMFHLGIATTRAGSLITSDSVVVRDILYDGHPRQEAVSIVSRIAPSFIRFGSFEIFKPMDPMTGREGPSVGLGAKLFIPLLNHVTSRFYPEIHAIEDHEERIAKLYAEICTRTAKVVADWQCVGFCHGVLNTDNMSILGLTIDYGPFGFMDTFNPEYICNRSDEHGRYSYQAQPEICRWNLGKLGEAFRMLLLQSEAEKILAETFDVLYPKFYLEEMRRKLGLLRLQLETDHELISSLFQTMRDCGSDMTNTFRTMCQVSITDTSRDTDILSKLVDLGVNPSKMKVQLGRIISRVQLERFSEADPAMLELMGFPRNFVEIHMQKLEKAEMYDRMTIPEKQEQDRAKWTEWIGKYRERLQLEIQVENSGNEEEKKTLAEIVEAERKEVMRTRNPKFVLRNYMAENAIKAAEKGDFTEVNRLQKLLTDPYAEWEELSEFKYDALPPSWSAGICVSCSS